MYNVLHVRWYTAVIILVLSGWIHTSIFYEWPAKMPTLIFDFIAFLRLPAFLIVAVVSGNPHNPVGFDWLFMPLIAIEIFVVWIILRKLVSVIRRAIPC